MGEEHRSSIEGDLIDAEEKDETTDSPKDSSETFEVEKRTRPTRRASKPVKYTVSPEDAFGEAESSVRKSKSESAKKRTSHGKSGSGSAIKRRLVAKLSDTEMECPECEFRTRTAGSFRHHLERHHSTNFILAGLALLCECGIECESSRHSSHCDIANFTVIRKRDGPIRRFEDEKTTPQCVLCEEYPRTACGYTSHLRIHHKSTLIANGIYLECECGIEYHHETHNPNHSECDGREFTLHKMNKM